MTNITRKTTSITETYDEQGKLITKETVEEIEYAPARQDWYGPAVPRQGWWQNPIVSHDSTVIGHTSDLASEVTKSFVDHQWKR